MSDRRLFILAHPEARRRAAQCIAEAPEGYRVTVAPPNRSLEQNDALHALLSDISERVEWSGVKHDVETWKRLLTAAWARSVGRKLHLLPALDGTGVEVIIPRTSSLTRAECSDLIEYIKAWMAEEVDESEAAAQ